MKGYAPMQFTKILNKHGWQFSRRNGTHHTYIKENHKNIITVPFHQKEMSRPVAQRLLKMAGIK